MKAIVCGGREYGNLPDPKKCASKAEFDRKCVDATLERESLYRTLDELKPSEIAEGGATGADTYAIRWARRRGIPCQTFRANWYPDGGPLDRAAGIKRNASMLLHFAPDVVVATKGGRGTKDMCDRARKAGVRVIEVPPETTEEKR